MKNRGKNHGRSSGKTPAVASEADASAVASLEAIRYANASLADLFKRWAAIQEEWNHGPDRGDECDAFTDAFSKLSHSLEVLMVLTGVHSAADATAVLDWHYAVHSGNSMYDWGLDARIGTSGALWTSLRMWLDKPAASAMQVAA